MSTAVAFNYPTGSGVGTRLSNERLIRQLPFGSTWNSLRVGFLVSMENSGAAINGEIWFGLCKWNTTNRPMDLTALAFRVGNGAYGTGLNLTWSGYNKRIYTSANGQRLSKFSAGTETVIATATNRSQCIPADDKWLNRAILLADFTQDASNWAGYQWGMESGAQGFTEDVAPGDALRVSRVLRTALAEKMHTGTHSLTYLHAGGPSAKNVSQGELDSMFIYARDHAGSSALNVHGYFVRRAG